MTVTASANALLHNILDANQTRPGAEVLLERLGLPLDLGKNLDLRYPAHYVPELLGLAAEWIPDQNFGFHRAIHADVKRYGAMGYLFAASQTLMEAYEHALRFTRIWNESIEYRIETGKNTTSIVVILVGLEKYDSFHPGIRHLMELTLTTQLRLARSLTAKNIVPRSVYFANPSGPNDSELRDYYRCPIHYLTRESKIVFYTKDLNCPLLHSDSELSSILVKYSEILLNNLPKEDDTWSTRVKQVLIPALGRSKITIKSIAKYLGVGERTLQRKLEKEKTTFQKLLMESWIQLAKKYLRDRSLSTSEIAYLLGFSGVSAFSNAFKRETQMSPNEYRKSKVD